MKHVCSFWSNPTRYLTACNYPSSKYILSKYFKYLLFSLFSFTPTIWLYQQFQYFGTEYHVMSTTYMQAVNIAHLYSKKLYLSQLTQGIQAHVAAKCLSIYIWSIKKHVSGVFQVLKNVSGLLDVSVVSHEMPDQT